MLPLTDASSQEKPGQNAAWVDPSVYPDFTDNDPKQDSRVDVKRSTPPEGADSAELAINSLSCTDRATGCLP